MGIDLNNGYEELKQHIGHEIVMGVYGDWDDPHNIAIECTTCMEVLLDFDKEKDEEEKVKE